MKNWLLDLLTCPYCVDDVPLEIKCEKSHENDVIEGALSCASCGQNFPITNGIPRFVKSEENYAENFGYQWNKFRATQIDRLANHSLSGTRLLKDTRWAPEFIHGKIILDAGCGAGRFADELAQNGARVIACDLSGAVDACKKTVDNPERYSRNRGDVTVVQANLLALPFKQNIFDAVHCAGVLQHTPAPAKIMRALPAHLKPAGSLFYNFYEIDLSSKFQVIKYFLRRWTPKWKMQNLVIFCLWMCRILFIPSWIMSRIPIIRLFNRFLPICSSHPDGLPLSQQYNMTLLDTIDWYGPMYEIRQDHKKIADLLNDAGMDQVETASGLAWAVKL